jgi:hypothetical protein
VKVAKEEVGYKEEGARRNWGRCACLMIAVEVDLGEHLKAYKVTVKR